MVYAVINPHLNVKYATGAAAKYLRNASEKLTNPDNALELLLNTVQDITKGVTENPHVLIVLSGYDQVITRVTNSSNDPEVLHALSEAKTALKRIDCMQLLDIQIAPEIKAAPDQQIANSARRQPYGPAID